MLIGVVVLYFDDVVGNAALVLHILVILGLCLDLLLRLVVVGFGFFGLGFDLIRVIRFMVVACFCLCFLSCC